MLFEVSRTSGCDYDKPPCNGAVLTKFQRVLKLRFKSPEEFNILCRPRKWFDEGSNHRVDSDGCIMRDEGYQDGWAIELNSLEELIKFKQDVGEDIIIGTSYIDYKTPSIEIYNDYRE